MSVSDELSNDERQEHAQSDVHDSPTAKFDVIILIFGSDRL
jgi:hypothetical protein